MKKTWYRKVNVRNHLFAWILWAIFYWFYSTKVAQSVPFDWFDYSGFLSMHIGSFYVSVFYLFPYANPEWNRFTWRTAIRLGLVVVAEVLAIAFAISLLSVLMEGLEVNLSTDDGYQGQIYNFWDVIIFLYSGLIFALFYLKFIKTDKGKEDAEQQVERLKVELNRAEMDNLSQALIPHMYNNMLGTATDAIFKQPENAPYCINLFKQVVHFYARLSPQDLVPMEDEIDVSEIFLELAEIRLGRKPAINFEIEEQARKVLVIPMITMLVMENFDKYAVVDDDEHAAEIYIGLKLGHLIIMARNKVKQLGDTPPLSTKKGIKSIEQRLENQGLSFSLKTEFVNEMFVFILIIRVS